MTTDRAPVRVPPVRVVFEEEDRKQILEAIDECLQSGIVSGGKHIRAFEEFWADYCGIKHAVGCSSGGAALEIILKALDVEGKDVLVPTNTFVASANAIVIAGGSPVFLDTDPATLGVTLDEIKARVTENTGAVMVVHIGGIMSPEMPAIADWCRSRGIPLVEDAAHAHGSEIDGKRAGRYGKAAAYSFFATKVVTSGEGGMVVTDDDAFADACRSIRDYGRKAPGEVVHTRISSNYRLSEIGAIIGLAQVRRLDDFIAHRQGVADRYTAALGDVLELVPTPGRCSLYKYIAYLPKGVERAAFKAALGERAVSLSGAVYDIPVHLQPVYEGLGLAGKLPVSEDVCERHVCLPVFFGMTDEQVEHTIASVRAVLAEMAT